MVAALPLIDLPLIDLPLIDAGYGRTRAPWDRCESGVDHVGGRRCGGCGRTR